MDILVEINKECYISSVVYPYFNIIIFIIIIIHFIFISLSLSLLLSRVFSWFLCPFLSSLFFRLLLLPLFSFSPRLFSIHNSFSPLSSRLSTLPFSISSFLAYLLSFFLIFFPSLFHSRFLCLGWSICV